MQRNDKGFTLIELLVSIAILAVITTAVGMLMTSGARTYSHVQNDLNLQYEGQIVLAQMQERIVDCNGGIAWDGDTLYVVHIEQDDDGAQQIVQYAYRSADNWMLYGTVRNTSDAAMPLEQEEIDLPMSDSVSALAVQASVGEQSRAEMLSLTVDMKRQGRADNFTQDIALRNKPLYMTDVSLLLQQLQEELEAG